MEHWQAATGGIASQLMDDGTIVGQTHWGIVYRYHPEKNGPGKMEDLGCNHLKPGQKEEECLGIYSPNLAVMNGKAYYAIGGHGKYFYKDKKEIYVVEKDLKTKKTRIIHKVDSRRCTEFTGSGIIDSKGNVYFGGHGQSTSAEDAEGIKTKKKKSDTKRRAFLVKFDPKKLIKKYAHLYKKM